MTGRFSDYKSREIIYSNLPPGKYTFQLKAQIWEAIGRMNLLNLLLLLLLLSGKHGGSDLGCFVFDKYCFSFLSAGE
jgi:hypothetical protein